LENVNNAIQAFESALKVYTVEGHMEDFGFVNMMLSELYMKIAESGNTDSDYGRAADAGSEALKVFNAGDYPEEHRALREKIESA
ncbi:hypothetical protein DF186_20415, partial [Enterococcus hirae]